MARAMKDSGIEWIGEIPLGWEIRRLRFLCSITTGNQDTQDNDPSGEYPFYVRSPVVERSNQFSFEGDAILMAGDGVGAGKIFHYVSGKYGCHQRVYSLQKIHCINRRLLYYYLRNRFYISIETANSKSTVDSVRLPMLQDFPVMLPPNEEQELIASFLDVECARIDAVINQTRASIEEYKKLKQAVITEAVTKGIRPGRKMKDSGVEWIKEVPEDWAVAKLKYFSSIRSGITLGKTYSRDTKLVEYPYLRVANVQGSYTDLTDVASILVTEEEAEKYRLHDGELLMTEGGDRDKLGRGTVWHAEIDPCLHQNHIFALKTNDDLSAEYVSFLSASLVGRDYFDVTANQSVHLASTNSTTIMNFTIPVPSIEEQNEIVSYLTAKIADLEKLIANKQTLISELESYKKSLIYEYVTGKKEVPAQNYELSEPLAEYAVKEAVASSRIEGYDTDRESEELCMRVLLGELSHDEYIQTVLKMSGAACT